jgi:hypothetical protein
VAAIGEDSLAYVDLLYTILIKEQNQPISNHLLGSMESRANLSQGRMSLGGLCKMPWKLELIIPLSPTFEVESDAGSTLPLTGIDRRTKAGAWHGNPSDSAERLWGSGLGDQAGVTSLSSTVRRLLPSTCRVCLEACASCGSRHQAHSCASATGPHWLGIGGCPERHPQDLGWSSYLGQGTRPFPRFLGF